MRAMILAAGRGKRLSPLTDDTPKPLIQVAGKALIEYQLLALKSAGILDVVINTGWLGEQLIKFLGNGQRYGVNIEYSIEPKEGLETGGGIFQALPLLGKEPFIVMNADIYHQISLADLRASVTRMKDKTLVHLMLVQKPTYTSEGDFCIVEGNQLSEKIKNYTSYTFSGIGIYRCELFKEVKLQYPTKNFSSVPLIKQAISSHQATGEISMAPWFDAGTVDRIQEIERFIHPIK